MNEMQPIDVLNQAVERYDPRYVIALFSGGHDSLVATHVASRHPRFSFACHINTGIGIEETRQFVRDTCRAWGIECREYKATAYTRAGGEPDPQRYEEIVCKHGFPGQAQHRLMYIRLKERPLEMMLRELDRKRSDRVLLVTGVRRQESVRRMAHVKPVQEWSGTRIWVAPLWDFSALDVNRYIEEHGLRRNEVKDKLHMSGECLCGAFAHRGELAEIEFWYPETAAYLRNLEARVRAAGFPWGWEDGPPPWWLAYTNGQAFLEGFEPEELMLCTSCEYRRGLAEEAA